jgi:hypothetical protein
MGEKRVRGIHQGETEEEKGELGENGGPVFNDDQDDAVGGGDESVIAYGCDLLLNVRS